MTVCRRSWSHEERAPQLENASLHGIGAPNRVTGKLPKMNEDRIGSRGVGKALQRLRMDNGWTLPPRGGGFLEGSEFRLVG